MLGYIPYGLRYGKMITIDEIKLSERGSLCDCLCPKCEKPLVAVLESSFQKPHFRHKKGYMHCSFDYDEGILELILEMLEEIDANVLNQIISSGIEHYTLKNKLHKQENISEKVKIISKPSLIKQIKKEILFKVIIDEEDFQVRITTSKKVEKLHDKEMIINISDLLSSKESTTRAKLDSIIKELKARASIKLANQLELKYNTTSYHDDPIMSDAFQGNTKSSERPETVNIEQAYMSQNYTEDNEDESSVLKEREADFMDYTIRNGTCPQCKEGKLVERFNRKGNPFFGCTTFPRCTYIHDRNDYYDEVEKKWVFHRGR